MELDIAKMDQRDVTILVYLSAQGKHISEISAVSLERLMYELGAPLKKKMGEDKQYKKFYNAMRRLEKSLFVSRGFKIGKQVTYYLTPKGKKIAEVIRNLQKDRERSLK